MINVTTATALTELSDGNRFFGTLPEMSNSEIIFRGSNNILYCEEGVRLAGSRLTFNGNNALVYLCKNRHSYRLTIDLYHNNVFYMGQNNYINGNISASLSEQKHIFIGNDNLFSFGIWMRTADPHLIYNIETKRRINPSKSIYIGDHVWIGQDAFLLKGSRIHSGSIIAARCVLSGKEIPSNTTWGGNPCRQIAEKVGWDGACVHAWTDEQTEKSQTTSATKHTFYNSPAQYIPFATLETTLNSLSDAAQRMEYLHTLSADTHQGRFALSLYKPSLWKRIKRKIKKLFKRTK